ncbi:MAG: phage terminase large subunit [Acidobacteriota bacterium]
MNDRISVGGVLTGRGADFIIIDDPLKPEEALSDAQRKSTNDWYDHTLISQLNDKRTGRIILIMQRLHEAILSATFSNVKAGRFFAFQPLRKWKNSTGYKCRSDEQESTFFPAALEGGMIKMSWFKTYKDAELLEPFEYIFQSWDTANKVTELSDYRVCTTWGVNKGRLYLLHVFRQRLEYPELKRAVLTQASAFTPKVVLIEDIASGTQLIQELIREGFHPATRYSTTMDKIMRMHTVTGTIENDLVYLPEKAEWLPSYIHEMGIFPHGKFDDRGDSTSQALDWVRNQQRYTYGLLEYYEQLEASMIKCPATPNIFLRPRGF